MDLSFKGSISLEHFLRAQRLLPAGRRFRWTLQACLGLLVGLLPLLVIELMRAWPGSHFEGVRAIQAATPVGFVAISLGVGAIVGWTLGQVWWKHAIAQSWRAFVASEGEMEGRVSEEGIHLRSAGGEGLRRWAGYQEAQWDDELVVLSLSGTGRTKIIQVVSRDQFDEASDWSEFMAAVRQRFPSQA